MDVFSRTASFSVASVVQKARRLMDNFSNRCHVRGMDWPGERVQVQIEYASRDVSRLLQGKH